MAGSVSAISNGWMLRWIRILSHRQDPTLLTGSNLPRIRHFHSGSREKCWIHRRLDLVKMSDPWKIGSSLILTDHCRVACQILN